MAKRFIMPPLFLSPKNFPAKIAIFFLNNKKGIKNGRTLSPNLVNLKSNTMKKIT